MHVLQDDDKPRFAENLAILLGREGRSTRSSSPSAPSTTSGRLPGDSPSGPAVARPERDPHGGHAAGFDPVQRPRVYPTPSGRWSPMGRT